MLSQYFLCGKEHVCDLDLNNLVSKLLIEQLNIKKKKITASVLNFPSGSFYQVTAFSHSFNCMHWEPPLLASLTAQLVRNLPAMQETPVRFLGQEDPTGEGTGYPLQYSWASLVTQMVKNPPAMREVWVRSLGWEDPLEKGKATHSSILAWRIPWTV